MAVNPVYSFGAFVTRGKLTGLDHEYRSRMSPFYPATPHICSAYKRR